MAIDISVTLQHPSPLQGLVTTEDITIQVESFSWGADNTASIGSATQGAGAGKAKFSEATFTKLADNAASPLLFQLLTQSGHLDTVTFQFRKSGVAGPGANNQLWITITLHAVFVTHFDQSIAAGDDSLREDVHLAYGSVQMTINGMDPSGKMTSGKPVTWNQVTNNSAIGLVG